MGIEGRWVVRNFVVKWKQCKADISTLQETGHFYFALTDHKMHCGLLIPRSYAARAEVIAQNCRLIASDKGR